MGDTDEGEETARDDISFLRTVSEHISLLTMFFNVPFYNRVAKTCTTLRRLLCRNKMQMSYTYPHIIECYRSILHTQCLAFY
jgi:hypothetical protein